MSNSDTSQHLETRQELVDALHFASVLEHMLACEYLFASYSAKRVAQDFPGYCGTNKANDAILRSHLDASRPWLSQINMIARQEMEHLGIVQNLLAAIGEEPFFWHPSFPVSSAETLLGAPFTLQRLDAETLQRFVWYERPNYLTPQFTDHFGDQSDTKLPRHEAMGSFIRTVKRKQLTSVESLYEAINAAFTNHYGCSDFKPENLYIGDTERQVGEDKFGYRVMMKSVTNQTEATAAINQILEQGEGIGAQPLNEDPAHFQRYLDILQEYEQRKREHPSFDPALPVVNNPISADRHPWKQIKRKRNARNQTELELTLPGLKPFRMTIASDRTPSDKINIVTNPNTKAVMKLANDAYSLTLVMMKAFFGTYSGSFNPTPQPQQALYYAGFFPMMTMVIRPLGEILARMPVSGRDTHVDPEAPHAGQSFEISDFALNRDPKNPQIRTELELDYYRSHIRDLGQRARELVDAVPGKGSAPNDEQSNLSDLKSAMKYLHENLKSAGLHMEGIWRQGSNPVWEQKSNH